jgi:hypothetical protein
MSFEHFGMQERMQSPVPKPPIERVDVYERAPRTERLISLSDIHNDLHALRGSLEQKKLIDKDGEWKYLPEPIHLVITGDSINKQNPDGKVLKYLKHLQETVPEGSSVTLLVGNHELDILAHDTEGKDTDLKDKRIEFLGTMQVVCKQGPVLFLHRYPSLLLIHEMEAQYTRMHGAVTNDSWDINKRFQDAVATRHIAPGKSLEVFRACDDGGEDAALEGMSPEAYFQKYGEVIGQLLARMGITVVVHGHKRQVSGGQHFEPLIPGVVMINNDTGISKDKNPEHKHRIASADISVGKDGTDITCVYKNDMKKHDMQVQKQTIH